MSNNEDSQFDSNTAEFSDEEDDVIEFEEDVVADDPDHDPLDDPQECFGKQMSCSKRVFRKALGMTLVAVAAFMFSLVTLGVKTSIHGGMDFGGTCLCPCLCVCYQHRSTVASSLKAHCT